MIVGLTGGIGSGKSAAANFFQNEGITVIDADGLSREVIEEGTPGFASIVEYFGSKIIDFFFFKILLILSLKSFSLRFSKS